MNRYSLHGLLAVGVLTAGLGVAAGDDKPDKDRREVVEGTITKVDPSAHRIHVRPPATRKQPEPPRREFPVGEATTFVFFAGGKRQEMKRTEAYKHEQLREGARVTVVSDRTGKVLEVRVGTPPRKEDRKEPPAPLTGRPGARPGGALARAPSSPSRWPPAR